jgi:hypothetical protein
MSILGSLWRWTTLHEETWLDYRRTYIHLIFVFSFSFASLRSLELGFFLEHHPSVPSLPFAVFWQEKGRTEWQYQSALIGLCAHVHISFLLFEMSRLRLRKSFLIKVLFVKDSLSVLIQLVWVTWFRIESWRFLPRRRLLLLRLVP